MRYHVLACDYDGTIAHHGRVDETTLAGLENLRKSGRRLVLVTGRQLPDLLQVFPRPDLFDWIVAENGGLLYRPETREESVLGEAPPEPFLARLREVGVPISAGRSIAATWVPHEKEVLEAIHDLGLELQVIFNKGAVMVLPSGVNKATGLKAALTGLGLSPHNAAGIGDAENDHAFLTLCELGAAVANALPALKERADYVTQSDHGAGVLELIGMLLESDLSSLEPGLRRHDVAMGTRSDGASVPLPPYGQNIAIVGTSGSGKSTFATGLLDRLGEKGYQYCVIDPEGDYRDLEGAVIMGDKDRSPAYEEILEVLEKPDRNAVVNLIGLSVDHRADWFADLLPRLLEMKERTGRPHWILIDEAHHMLPSDRPAASPGVDGFMIVTVHPGLMAKPVLERSDWVAVMGDSAASTLEEFCGSVGVEKPSLDELVLDPGQVLLWHYRSGEAPTVVRSIPPRVERRRHFRKYVEGELGPDRSFYFRGPEGRLNLRAQNLTLFSQLARGVDEETWLHHLRSGEYSRWFREFIKDEELADEVAEVEKADGNAEATRRAVLEAIERRYAV